MARRVPSASSPTRLVATALVAASALLSLPPACLADGSMAAARPGDPGMPAHPAALLVGHLERFLKDHDLDAFRRNVELRYTEGTLCRATFADDVRIRRAAVLALGVGGSYACNATVARRLKDKDPTTRSMAVSALWAIWCRADTPENNTELEAIQALIQAGRHDEAIRRAGRLVERARASRRRTTRGRSPTSSRAAWPRAPRIVAASSTSTPTTSGPWGAWASASSGSASGPRRFARSAGPSSSSLTATDSARPSPSSKPRRIEPRSAGTSVRESLLYHTDDPAWARGAENAASPGIPARDRHRVFPPGDATSRHRPGLPGWLAGRPIQPSRCW